MGVAGRYGRWWCWLGLKFREKEWRDPFWTKATANKGTEASGEASRTVLCHWIYNLKRSTDTRLKYITKLNIFAHLRISSDHTQACFNATVIRGGTTGSDKIKNNLKLHPKLKMILSHPAQSCFAFNLFFFFLLLHIPFLLWTSRNTDCKIAGFSYFNNWNQQILQTS